MQLWLGRDLGNGTRGHSRLSRAGVALAGDWLAAGGIGMIVTGCFFMTLLDTGDEERRSILDVDRDGLTYLVSNPTPYTFSE